MKETIRVLTILVGVISIVSFAQRLFDIGVVAIAKDIIEYYRVIAHSILAAPMELLGIKVYPSITDAWALSFIGASAYARTPKIEQSRFFSRHPWLIVWKYWKVWLLFLFGITGIGIFVLIGTLSPITYVDEYHKKSLDLYKGAARNTLYIFGGALVFFVLNAFAPSV